MKNGSIWATLSVVCFVVLAACFAGDDRKAYAQPDVTVRAEATGAEGPVEAEEIDPQVEREQRVERINAWFAAKRNTIDAMINSAKNAQGPLHWYRGDLSDHDAVVEFLLETQYHTGSDPWSGVEGCTVDGGWGGDVRDSPHFDERVMELAMGILVEHKVLYGPRQWTLTDGRKVSQLSAMWRGYKCIQREQHIVGGGFDWRERGWGFQGIPGGWPIRPGTCDGKQRHAISNERAKYVTYNDGATSSNMAAILYVLTQSPGYGPAISRSMLCAEGTWEIMQRNGGFWLPEQCDRTGTPTWGRQHEPPCWSPRATAHGVEILCMAHAVSGDPMWLERAEYVQESLNGFEQVPGGWHYMLEPKTCTPIFVEDSNRNVILYSPLTAKSVGSVITFNEQWERHPQRSRSYLRRYKEGLGID